MSHRFGKYSVVYRLGAGGMAEVFKCRLSGIGGFNKLVVVKRIKPELAGDPGFRDMFLDEARIAANLQHPNVVQIFEIDQAEGLPYIAMEYVRGPTLALINREERKRGTPRGAVVAHVMAGICAGLDYAHRAVDERGTPLGIIHRDVSPQNIIISTEGVPKLLDFGVAKARGQLSHTSAGALKGKLKFMAPEQFVVGGELTPAVDLFAAGVCMYEAVTLQLPYAGQTELEVMRAAAAGRFARPRELVPTLDRRLEELILWAMATRPADRCPDAHTLQLALEDYAERARCTAADVAQYIAELFPAAAADTVLKSAYVDVDSRDILGPPSVVRHTELQRGADLGLEVAARDAAMELFELTPPPRESRAPVWGAVASVALIAVLALCVAIARQRPTLLTLPAPSAVSDAGVAAAVATAAAPASPVKPPPRIEPLLRAAHDALDHGRYVEAAELARRVLSEQLDEPRATALLLEAMARERDRDRERERERERARERVAAVIPPPAPAPPPVKPRPPSRRRVERPAPVEAPPEPEAAPEEPPLKTPPEPEVTDEPPPAPPPPIAVEPPRPLAPANPLSRITLDCADGSRLVRASLYELWCELGREREGPYLRLWSNGRKAIEGEYRRGKKHGRWLEYYEGGGERARVEWRRGVQMW